MTWRVIRLFLALMKWIVRSRNVDFPRMDLDTEKTRETHNLYICVYSSILLVSKLRISSVNFLVGSLFICVYVSQSLNKSIILKRYSSLSMATVPLPLSALVNNILSLFFVKCLINLTNQCIFRTFAFFGGDEETIFYNVGINLFLISDCDLISNFLILFSIIFLCIQLDFLFSGGKR